MKIHTFGDSHSQFGWDSIPDISIHHLGPKLCWSIGRDGLDIRNYSVENNDTVIFCFGEIDCRCHVHKYITESTSYKSVINTIIEKYFVAIKQTVSQYKNLKICVYNVVPPIEKYNTTENPDYPFLGSDKERKEYVLYFNEKLKEKCKEYNYVFFDIYTKYTDDNGFLNKSLSDDNVHISNGVFIKEFVENKLIKKASFNPLGFLRRFTKKVIHCD